MQLEQYLEPLNDIFNMPFNPNSVKKVGKNLKEVLQKKEGPSIK